MCVFDPSGSKSSSTVGKVMMDRIKNKITDKRPKTIKNPMKMKPEESSK
ncbi:hypothetical protein L9Z41_04545 [Leptospira noguchii]|nr:hypothetical protein [Leptospira noguchii]MCH1914930.1 hypothetical protein [Leptospira noguchii]